MYVHAVLCIIMYVRNMYMLRAPPESVVRGWKYQHVTYFSYARGCNRS